MLKTLNALPHVAALAIIAFGCGSSAPADVGADAEPAESAPAAQVESAPPRAQPASADRELVLGHVTPFTGALADFGEPHRNAVELAIEHINAAGGVDGAMARVVHVDSATAPETGAAAALALVNDEGVVAIVGGISSAVTIAIAESAATPEGVLQLSSASTSPQITELDDDDFVFRTTVSDTAQGIVMATLAKSEDYRTAGILYIDNAFGQGLAAQFEETYTFLGGEITGKASHGDSQESYADELAQATAGNPRVLVSVSYPGQARAYLPELERLGYEGNLLLTSALKSPELASEFGDELEGAFGTSPGTRESASSLAFREAYAAAYGEAPTHRGVAGAYDAVTLIALAAAKVGKLDDSKAIRDALREVAGSPGTMVQAGPEGIAKALALIAQGEDIDYEGASGSLDFDANGDVSGTIEIWKVEGGRIATTGRFEYPYVPDRSKTGGPTAW